MVWHKLADEFPVMWHGGTVHRVYSYEKRAAEYKIYIDGFGIAFALTAEECGDNEVTKAFEVATAFYMMRPSVRK